MKSLNREICNEVFSRTGDIFGVSAGCDDEFGCESGLVPRADRGQFIGRANDFKFSSIFPNDARSIDGGSEIGLGGNSSPVPVKSGTRLPQAECGHVELPESGGYSKTLICFSSDLLLPIILGEDVSVDQDRKMLVLVPRAGLTVASSSIIWLATRGTPPFLLDRRMPPRMPPLPECDVIDP
jgi:hypothetical protein